MAELSALTVALAVHENVQIEGLMAELSTLTAASGFPSGLRQRVVDNVLAQPELKTIMDYVIKVQCI